MRHSRLAPLIASGVLLSALARSADTPPKLRLSEVQQAKPQKYDVDLTLDPDREDFTGSIIIQLNIEQPLPVLWLNATNIDVKNVTVSNASGRQTPTVLPGG